MCTIKLLFTASIDLCLFLHQVNQLALARVGKNVKHAHTLARIHSRIDNRMFTVYRSSTNTVYTLLLYCVCVAICDSPRKILQIITLYRK